MVSTQNQMQVFENKTFGKIRATTIDGEPWFVAADVCDYFGVTNRNRVMQAIDEDEKGGTQMYTPGGMQTVTILSEAGLYSLLFALQPKKARGVSDEYIQQRYAQLKAFKRWITHEVIPSIRRTGGFVADADAFLMNYLPNADEQTKLMFRAQLSVIRDLDNKVARQNRLIEEQVQEISDMKPKASYCDHVLATNNVVPISIIAKDYGMSAQAMNKKLNELGIQYPCRGTWIPYAKYQKCGYTKTRTFLYDDGHGGSGSGVHTCWTQKGRMFLYDELKKEGILPVMEQEE